MSNANGSNAFGIGVGAKVVPGTVAKEILASLERLESAQEASSSHAGDNPTEADNALLDRLRAAIVDFSGSVDVIVPQSSGARRMWCSISGSRWGQYFARGLPPGNWRLVERPSDGEDDTTPAREYQLTQALPRAGDPEPDEIEHLIENMNSLEEAFDVFRKVPQGLGEMRQASRWEARPM
jgi:hypothetical protein